MGAQGVTFGGYFNDAFAGKTVLVTGHTGFKGAWLSLWLNELGARVVGYALAPDTERSLFTQLGLPALMESHICDVRDRPRLQRVFDESRPEFVFHLAAQALVRRSYREPVDTFSTNVLGTAHVLDAVRTCDSVRVCQVVTSDKCYENHGGSVAFKESDPMGGHDPYSGSKGCAELVVASYRKSFFSNCGETRPAASVSSVRAGNVIGGGDWAEDRLIPDCVRALSRDENIPVRNPKAIRPWQHVLEPLSGYLRLASLQAADPERYAQAWNFGPLDEDVTVVQIAEMAVREWGAGSRVTPQSGDCPAEAPVLRLDCRKAETELGWSPVLSTAESLADTIAWYRAEFHNKDFDAASFTRDQIRVYTEKASGKSQSWAAGGSATAL